MGGDSRCCGQWLTLRTAVRVIACLFGMSTVVYVYLYNMSLVNTSTQLFQQRFNISAWASESFHLFKLSNTRSLLYNFKTGEKNSTFVSNSSGVTNKYNVTVSKPVTSTPNEGIPLLTLFTTWPPNDKKYTVRNITLRNWARFKPLIRPIFFSSNGTNIKDVIKNGWDVLPVSKTAGPSIPVLKYMYLDVMKKYKSLFYGYANGDILFDDSLISTLLTVANASVRQDKPIFIMGRRTNVNSVTDEESKNIDNLAAVAKKRGKLFINVAQDYFITDSSYPWADIPGVVIGRRAYDNWLVLHSCKQKHTVIDATNSLLALHQSTKAGNFEGHSHKDSNFNVGLLSKYYKNIQYMAGSTACAPWATNWVSNTSPRRVELTRKKKLDKICFQY